MNSVIHILEVCGTVAPAFIKDRASEEDARDGLKYMMETLKKISHHAQHEPLLIKPHRNTCLVSVACDCIGEPDKPNDEEIALKALQFIGQLLSVSSNLADKLAFNDILSKVVGLTFSARNEVCKTATFVMDNYVLSGLVHARAFAKNYAAERVVKLADDQRIDIKAEALYTLCHCITQAEEMGDSTFAKLPDEMTVAQRILGHEYGVVIKSMIQGLRVDDQRLHVEIFEALLILIEYKEGLDRLEEDETFGDLIEDYVIQPHPDANLDKAANLRNAFLSKREEGFGPDDQIDSPMAFEGEKQASMVDGMFTI